MDEQLSKLKQQIEKIETLKKVSEWGPEFQLWKRTTEKIVGDLFGDDGLKLFKQQQTVTVSYISGQNRALYFEELDRRKRILEGLITEIVESQPIQNTMSQDTEMDILKNIWHKEQALKENLLPTNEVKKLYDDLSIHLQKILPIDSLPGLRFKKFITSKPVTWWSTNDGYPASNPWEKFQPLLELLEQHEAEKTIKHRLETEGLFVESRSQDEDQHLLIGQRDGTGKKAHMIIDGKTGEIRIEDNGKEPTDLLSRIEVIFTLPGGKKIVTTREAIEEIK